LRVGGNPKTIKKRRPIRTQQMEFQVNPGGQLKEERGDQLLSGRSLRQKGDVGHRLWVQETEGATPIELVPGKKNSKTKGVGW